MGENANGRTQAKVSDLAAQLSRIHDPPRETDLDWRLAELEERVSRAQNCEETAFRALLEKVARAEQLLAAQRLAREATCERARKELKGLESACRAEAAGEAKELAELEAEAAHRFEKNAEKLRKEFVEELNTREEQLQEGVGALAERLGQLQNDFLAERAAREEAYDGLIRRVGSQLLRVNNLLGAERKSRESAHNELLLTIGETQARLQRELAEEAEARRRNQDALLRVLEETCVRIERNIR